MKKNFLFALIILFLCVIKAFAIEEIVPDFSDEEIHSLRIEENKTFTEKVFGQKEIHIGNELLDRIEYGVNYRGTLNFTHYDEENSLSTSYPFTIEPYIHMYSKEDKNQFRLSILPTGSHSVYDHEFSSYLNDIYFIRKFNENHLVLIGNSRTPVGFEGGEGAYQIKFAKRSQIAANFGDTRALGIRFKGNVKMFDYDLGFYSSTRKLQHIDDGPELVGFLTYNPFYNKKESALKSLRIGSGIDYGRRFDNNYTVLSTGVNWEHKKWYLGAEYGFAQNYNGSRGYQLGKAQGANATVGYKITEKLQILGRYDAFNPDMGHGSSYKTQYTAGLNYYLVEDRVKFILNYIFEQNKHNNKNMVMFYTQFMI